MSGNSLASALVHRSLLDGVPDIRQPEFHGVRIGRVLRHQVDARRVDRLAVRRHRIGQIPGQRARLAVAVRDDVVLDADALDAAGQVGRPGHVTADLLDGGKFVGREFAVPAELLEHAQGELRIAVLDLRILGIGLGQQRYAVALDAETGAEGAAAVLDALGGVVEQRRARMLDLRLAPARPRQAVVVAADLRGVLGRAHSDQVERRLMLHVRLQPLRRLAAIAGGEAAAVHFAQHVLGRDFGAVDLDVLEHLVFEAELLGEQVDHLAVVLRFEDRRHDLLAPLDRAVGGDARAGRSRTGCRSATDRCCPCARHWPRATPRWSDADRRPPADRARPCPWSIRGYG